MIKHLEASQQSWGDMAATQDVLKPRRSKANSEANRGAAIGPKEEGIGLRAMPDE